ncbi:MAG TPA: MMPL family transporter [Nevskiaceae bacterium]|nr:MMPL family transporter [Nevskiaceae bacterium]
MSGYARFIDWLSRHPATVLGLALLLSLAAAAQVIDLDTGRPRITIDVSTDRLLPPSDQDRQVFERAREVFGDADAVLMAVEYEAIFAETTLAQIAALTRALEQLPGVEGVFSLATAPNLLAQGEDLEVSSFTEQAAADPARIPLLANELAANPLYAGTLVSADGRRTLLAISLDAAALAGGERGPIDRFRELAQAQGARSVWITGSPVVQAATTEALLDSLAFIIPTIYALIVVMLFLAFRCLRSTLAVVFCATQALLWTAAAAAALDLPLNLVTVITPPLVITLGLAYAIHVLSEHFSSGARTRAERAARSLEVMSNMTPALMLSGITTIAGFLALLPNVLPSIRQFALLSSLGVMALVINTLFVLPALLHLLRTGSRAHERGEKLTQRWAGRLAAFDIKWRNQIIAVGLILVPVNLWLASSIPVGADYIGAFREQAPVRVEYEAINAEFNGANLAFVFIDTYVDDALTDPRLVAQIDQLQAWLRSQPEVGATASYVDHLKLLNQGLNSGDPAYFGIPDDPAAIKQLLLFGGSEQLERAIDARYRAALITVRLKVRDSIAIGAFAERAEARLRQLPPPLNGKLTGSPVLATRTVNEIGSGQWQSLLLASLAIWAMLAFMFTSLRAGLWAMLPNLVPVSVYFGTLSLLGIPLNPTNSLIASIVLGIAVDDTVHYLARFNRHARATGSETAAVRSALAATLKPVTLTTVALCSGLLVFTGSELLTQVQFGLLAAFTLLLAWVSELLLTPALGSRLRIVTLWDLLRLDLGQSPQHTIPLLSGLSLRQARVFALMSKLEAVPAGQRVITQGDLARDMYVVVDGTVEAWLERGEERKRLATMTRGAVMGEAGYFGQRRTANVDALTPVRLLRFDSQDLERLRRRYPSIAATIFRNLNRIQAERLARATAMLQ